MITGYIDKKSRTISKEKLIQDGKEDVLREVIAEEKEIADLVQQIIFWAHQGGFKDMTCHQIIILTKQVLKILQIEDEKLHAMCDRHKHTEFERVHTSIDEFEHLVKLTQMHEEKIKAEVKKIGSLIEDYKQDRIDQAKFSGSITEACNEMIKLVGLDESHLETVHHMLAEHKEAEKRERLKRFRNIKK